MRWFIRLACMMVAAAQAVVGQGAVARPLAAPDATLSEEFARLRGARELPDGRLLVTDVVDHRVAVVDWATSRVTTIGRTGDGPGEYRYPEWLFAIGGDSTLLLDTTTRRWLILAGTRIVATVPATEPLNKAFSIYIRGADRTGHIMATPRNNSLYLRRLTETQTGVPTTGVDSIAVLVGSRTTGTIDTLARLRSASLRQTRAFPKGAGHDVTWILQNPLDVGEQATLFQDGWIAAARMEPFRLDWRRPDGTWIRGADVPEQRIRVDDRIKRAAIARKFPAASELPFDPSAYPEWPTTVPPFPTDQPVMFALHDGRAAVRRVPDVDNTNRYDVFDRLGKRVSSFALPSSQVVLTFGARSVYVIATDADGIERLHRHPWP